ncbi:MAG TPA: protein kinase [Pyrinomonadaceae bacterium]|nr:protein kinase [Pyrinomonadaceae bacterium]
MTLTAGTRLGRYEIRAQLGVGGQGAVYKAVDTKLGRVVVIKVLPPELTVKEVNLKRFEREARLASALDHPNICTIFDFGEEGGLHFIAMQYVEGRNVRQLVAGRPLELASALSIAAQVADALAAAHAHGIIHRDVKAGNVVVTDDGLAKVLDFGLAKLMDEGEAAPDDAHLTEIGVPYGTATYAAPEQARGLRVDHRADIFSTGVLLYELLTGTWPFRGKTALDVRFSVLHDTPTPLAEARRDPVPPRLQEILDRALAKEPEDRYQTMEELRDDLKGVLREISSGGEDVHLTRGAAPVAPRHAAGAGRLSRGLGWLRGARTGGASTSSAGGSTPSTAGAQGIHATSSAEYLVTEIKRHKRGAAVALALVVLTLAGAAFGVYRLLGRGRRGAPFQTMNIARLTTTGKATDVALSPDGKYVVHVMSEAGRQSLWVRRVAVAASNVKIVEEAEVVYRGLTFSPDGEFVYYVAGGGGAASNALYQVPVLGGPAPKKLLDEVDSPVTFSPDGRRFAFVRRSQGEGEAALLVANADGGGARKLAARRLPDFFNYPAWSPDGETIACSVTGYTGGFHGSVVAVRAEDGKERPVSERRWASLERLAWLADGSGLVLIAQDDPASPVQIWWLSYPGGEAERVTHDLNNYGGVSLTADSSALATVQSDMDINIWAATGGDAGAARQVTSVPSGFNDYWGVSWTPDGRLVYGSTASGNQDIWVMDADGGNQRQLTDDPRQDFDPSATPDGRYILFTSLRAGATNIWRMNPDGSGQTKLTGGKRDFVPSPSPDGRWVVYTNGDSESLTLWKVPVEGGAPVRLTEHQANWPAVSPDGKLIACWYRGEGEKLQKLAAIPSEGGDPVKVFDISPTVSTWAEVRWVEGGRALAYIDTHNGVSQVWSQPLEGGPPRQLTHFKADQIFRFDWSSDGKRLAYTRGKVTSDVILISNAR